MPLDVRRVGDCGAGHSVEVAVSHTPGPWHADPGDSRTIGSIVTEDGITVAQALRVLPREIDPLNQVRIANARLIAAAPGLLVALKAIWAMFDDGSIVRNINNDGKPDWALRMLTFTQELQTVAAAIAKAEGK